MKRAFGIIGVLCLLIGFAGWQINNPSAAGGSGDALVANPLSQFAATTSLQLKGVLSDETGSGAAVFATSPALVTPDLGTPSAAVLTSATGLPISTGVSGLAAGIATALATPSSANLATAVTDETGSGALVFGTSPTLTTPTFTGAVTKTGQGEAVSASGAINTAETILVQSGGGTAGAALAANRLIAKTRILVTITGTCTSTVANASHFRIRIGTGGTTSDTAAFDVTTPTAATSGTNVPFRIILDMVVRTAGASATSYGEYSIINQGTTGLSAVAANTAAATMTNFDTTAADFITVTYVSAAATTTSTFQTASIEFPNN